jgi:hypothetical protein
MRGESCPPRHPHCAPPRVAAPSSTAAASATCTVQKHDVRHKPADRKDTPAPTTRDGQGSARPTSNAIHYASAMNAKPFHNGADKKRPKLTTSTDWVRTGHGASTGATVKHSVSHTTVARPHSTTVASATPSEPATELFASKLFSSKLFDPPAGGNQTTTNLPTTFHSTRPNRTTDNRTQPNDIPDDNEPIRDSTSGRVWRPPVFCWLEDGSTGSLGHP